MQDLSTIRKRDGAFYWGLFQHDNKENVYWKFSSWFTGRALAPTWTDDSRYRSIQEHALVFHIDERPPNVSHFIAGPFQSNSQRTDGNDNNI